MQQDTSARALRAQLEAGTIAPDAAIDPLVRQALGAPVRSQRLAACALLGDVAGRAFGAEWEAAERAAFQLLSLARLADAPQDRGGVVRAMGRAFRNAWLLPFVHRRLSDHDPEVVIAAINAAGGLGFPALEEAVAAFVDPDRPSGLRHAAIAALGRMGAMSAVPRLVALVDGDPEASCALAALTEIRSGAAVEIAAAVLDREPERDVLIAGVRYLAELGSVDVLPHLRRLARDDDAELRLVASFASRTFKAERDRDAGERFLIALTERDRAVRAVLARRLRTVPVAQVIEHAEMLIGDEPAGVVQVLGEVREPDVTRHLLALAGRDGLPLLVRARAAGAIEANLPWEREALATLAGSAAAPLEVRAAAAQTLGAFATPAELLAAAHGVAGLAGAAEPELRGAFLWALQLAVRPGALPAADRARAIAAIRPLLADGDVAVRRRAAYVTGNLELDELAPALVGIAAGDARADVRLAALVGLAELAPPAVFDDVVAIAKKEADPAAFAAASRALAAIVLGAPKDQDHKLDLSSLSGKLGQLFAADDPWVREAAVRLAGLARGAVGATAIARLAGDPVPAVRAEALTALGRLRGAGGADAESTLIAAFADPDPALHERAADGLLAIGGKVALEHVLAFVSGEGDPAARAAIAPRIEVPPTLVAAFRPAVDAALERVGADDVVYEPLLALKVTLLEQGLEGQGRIDPAQLDDGIVGAFPSFAHMIKLRGFEQLVKSIRTAEGLYRSVVGATDADLSPPIVLWMKVLENYVHAWLGARMNTLQRDPLPLFSHVDHLVTGAWPRYQQFVGQRWQDPVAVGNARVELPVRSLPNALRELQEHKRKRLDSPLSVTEWSRLMVFFAVDHPSGVKNLFKLPVKSADQSVRLAHRLHTLAAVRNLVTHRAVATGPTLEAFRKGYYAAFEELAQMA
jgi:HEAT repeat protein